MGEIMDEVTLPPLPPPPVQWVVWDGKPGWSQYHDADDPMPSHWDCEPPHNTTDYYTADQMRAYAQQAASAAVLQERERCAKICDDAISTDDSWDNDYWNRAAEHCAAAIRTAPKEGA